MEELAQGGPQSGGPCAYNRFMNKTQAIQILSTAFGGSYTGTEVVPACSGNLIQDIMNEGSEGKTFHRWECSPLPRCVEDSQLIAVAKHYV